MIEDGLFLALGFCLATVLALACLPLLWVRALRLTRQRLELLVPWSKAEIDAERDGWRAQSAVQHRRLEQAVENEQARLATRTVELGLRTADLSRAEAARDDVEAARRRLVAELAAETHALRDSEGQRGALEKALHDADRRIETDAAFAREQARNVEQLAALADERRASIAALETRAAGLQARIADRDDVLARMTAASAEAAATRAALATELDGLRSALATLADGRDEMTAALAAERRAVAEHDERLRQRAEALAAAEARMADQDAAARRQAEELASLRRRFDALQRELEARSGATDADEDALRTALAALGDDTLRVLAPEAPAPAEPPGVRLVRERL